MVNMCECVCLLFPVNDVHYSDIHVKFLLLPPLGKATCSNWANSTHKQQALSQESECERQRKQQHTRIGKVMGNYKGTGWQLCLQTSSLALAKESATLKLFTHSIEVRAIQKPVEMPLWLPIYETTPNITPPF